MGSLPEQPGLPSYAELHCLSNFSFLRGASHAEELVERAVELGYSALAVTDECSLAGIVRAHVAAKKGGIKLLVGSEIRFEDGLKLVLLAPDRKAYGALASLITTGRRRAKKGAYALSRRDLEGTHGRRAAGAAAVGVGSGCLLDRGAVSRPRLARGGTALRSRTIPGS
jgi:error-prone DNA polymerase